MTTRILSALAAAAALAACSDAPLAPGAALAPSAQPVRAAASLSTQRQVGDTVVTEFTVGTNNTNAATYDIGHQSKITFGYGYASICDPTTSSYGPGTWNSPCQATRTATRITAKVWRDARGKVNTDFQPALRFVPGLRKPVLLTLKDAALAGTRVDYCSPAGCVDESAADPSLRTTLDATNGFAYRVIKHFSGYNVVVDRSSDGFDSGF